MSWSIVVLTLVFHNPLLVLRYLIENNLNQTYTYNSTVHEGVNLLLYFFVFNITLIPNVSKSQERDCQCGTEWSLYL